MPSMMRIRTILFLAALALLPFGLAQAAIVPLDGLRIVHAGSATEAERLAVQRFNMRVKEFTGRELPEVWSEDATGQACIRIGTAASEPARFAAVSGGHTWPEAADPRAQSYCIAVESGETPSILALGASTEQTPRATLGLSYALGELLRRLDIVDGAWRFDAPDAPIYQSPAVANRTLYVNLDSGRNPAIALECMSHEALEKQADLLIEACYSRLSFWQAYPFYLYPGTNEALNAANMRMHTNIRYFFDYARRRGFEIYHQLTPAYFDTTLLGENPEQFRGVGWYSEKPGHGGLCWNKPEVREAAKRVAQFEMEYFAPVDGYLVWFYDPAGCFCEECKPRQAEMLFSQLMLVADLAKNISPGAEMQAVLWPTWCFPDYKDKGIPFTAEERDAFVKEFLQRVTDQFGPKKVPIVDSCEAEITNMYNGLVDPNQFARNGFIYSFLGYPGESAYLFMPFQFHLIAQRMGHVRETGLEECTLYDHYPPITFPIQYGVAHELYAGGSADELLKAYAATMAKGEAYPLFVEFLQAFETMDQAKTYRERGKAITHAEKVWEKLKDSQHLYASRDWLDGYVKGQRHYLNMSKARTEKAFLKAFQAFKDDLGGNPIFGTFVLNALTPEIVAKLQLPAYWRAPCNDNCTAGVPNH